MQAGKNLLKLGRVEIHIESGDRRGLKSNGWEFIQVIEWNKGGIFE